MIRFLKITLILSALIFASSTNIYAAGYGYGEPCPNIYGGGEVCPPAADFSLEKSVQIPGKGGTFTQDSIDVVPGQDITFKISVKNIGSQTISRIEVADKLPEFLNLMPGGTAASVDETKTKLIFVITNLQPNEVEDLFIVTKVADAKNLPDDKALTCVTNQAIGLSNIGGQQSSFAEVCIEKQISALSPKPQVFNPPPIISTPATGPEMLPLIGLLPSGLIGLLLRKRSRPH